MSNIRITDTVRLSSAIDEYKKTLDRIKDLTDKINNEFEKINNGDMWSGITKTHMLEKQNIVNNASNRIQEKLCHKYNVANIAVRRYVEHDDDLRTKIDNGNLLG